MEHNLTSFTALGSTYFLLLGQLDVLGIKYNELEGKLLIQVIF